MPKVSRSGLRKLSVQESLSRPEQCHTWPPFRLIAGLVLKARLVLLCAGLGCGEPLDHQHFVNSRLISSHLISSRLVLTLIIWMSERSEYLKKEFEYFEKEFEYRIRIRIRFAQH